MPAPGWPGYSRYGWIAAIPRRAPTARFYPLEIVQILFGQGLTVFRHLGLASFVANFDGYAGDRPGIGAAVHAIGKVQMISLRPESAGRVSACDFVWRKPMRPVRRHGGRRRSERPRPDRMRLAHLLC